jgi:methyl-accepting chemotaxis protein
LNIIVFILKDLNSMKSIKYKMLVSFCVMAAISILAVAGTVSWKISDSISHQSETFAADMTTRTYETLNLPHQTFELLIREEIRHSVIDLCQTPALIANLEVHRLKALREDLKTAALKDALDFAIIVNFKGQLEASFPPDLDDFEVENYFTSWNFGAYVIENALQEDLGVQSPVWETFSRHDAQALQVLGVGGSNIAANGALSIVSASIVTNDFAEPLGICLVGKLLNGYEEPLQRLHAIAGYTSVLYLDTTPIAEAGFELTEEESDLASFHIPPELQTEVYMTNTRTNQVLTFAGTPYLSACSALKSFADENLGILCVGLPESNITAAKQTILSHGMDTKNSVQKWILGIGVISLGFFALTSLIIATRIVAPIKQLSHHAKKIAAGDFQQPITVKSKDEIGELSQSLCDVVNSFQDISATSEAIAVGNLTCKVSPRSEQDTLGHALQYMSAYLSDMASMAEAVAQGDLTGTIQVRSTDDVLGKAIMYMTEGLRALIEQIKTSVKQITATQATISSLAAHDMRLVRDAHRSVEQTTGIMAGMEMSVEEVAQNMETLSSSVEETSNAVTEMTASIAHIASNTTNLTHQTHRAIKFIEQSVSSLEEIVKSIDTSKSLAQETSQDALEGQQAMEQVMTSMETIQQTISTAVEAITRFAQRSREIDTILAVIREITEQTSLLALNASIIAAQAGTHGRGFAVVAEEIKNLARGVTSSTKDIAAIVKSLQQETGTVVQTVHEGAEDVKQGMERTKQAQAVLNKILTSAQRSSSVVTEIADALYGLKTISHNVFSAMEQVNAMTDDITGATNQQKIGTSQINQAVLHINDMASQIQKATSDQLTGVHQVLDSANTVTELMDQNLKSSQEIARMTEELSLHATFLLQSVDQFTLESQEKRELSGDGKRGGQSRS